MTRSAATPRAAAILAVAVVLAACGSTPAATADSTVSPSADPTTMESMDHSPSAAESESAAASPSDQPADDGDADGAEVIIGGSSFSPGLLTVAAGTEVTFVNSSGLPHTVTHGTNGRAADDPAFDQPVSDGGSVTIAFDEPGTYEVTCKLHPSMQMTVTVEG
ncbi:MAG TPA: plastocyanin/azurin family copper-binding protein [Candidatus Angelobacter sp.]|nr:plastocyanin/azurin family copper-binding protein [Candidatus Angelobacter sp.]